MLASVNGVNLYFDVEGAGLVPDGPNMVERLPCFVLHGGPALDHSYFKPWLSPLADKAQLIYVDHRGTGRSSEAPPETYRLPQMAADLEELRRHVGLDRVGVIGSSYGGFLAMTYVLAFPASVERLMLLGTAASYRFWPRAGEILAKVGSEEQRALGPRLLEGHISTAEEYSHWWTTMLPLYFADPANADTAAIAGRIRGNPRTSYEMFNHDMPTYDVEANLASIEAPTWVGVGRHDWITPVEDSQIIADGIPNSELVIFEDSGHFVFIEEQEKFIRLAGEFLDVNQVVASAPRG